MTELMKMVIELKKMSEENDIMSIVKGNRNWGIKIEIIPESGNIIRFL